MSPIRPTIAVLSPTPTHPHDFGNRKRLYQVCSGLQERGARIEFIYYPVESDWRERCPHSELQAMRERWDGFEFVQPSIRLHKSARRLDHRIDEWWDPVLEPFLTWYFATRPVDAFIVNYVYLSKAFEFAKPHCLNILDTHDVLAGRREKLAALGIGPEFFHTTVEQENTGFERADLLIAIKEEEETEIGRRVAVPTITLPYCESTRDIPARPVEEAGRPVRFGFLGALNSMNTYNLRRFLDVALPIWRHYMAPLEFVIAGSVCKLVEDLADTNGVQLLGRVDSVDEFYQAVDAVLIPMDVSTGQKIKTGEALGYGMPVIAHYHAFEGYAATSPLHRCGTFEEMARACVDIAFEPEKLESLRQKSIEAQYLQARRNDTALEKLLEQTIAANPIELFVLDAERLACDALYAQHTGAIALEAAKAGRTYVYIAGRCDRRHRNFLDLIGQFCRVFAGEVGDVAEPFAIDALENPAMLLIAGYRIRRLWAYADIDYRPFARGGIEVMAVGTFSPLPIAASATGVLIGGGLPYFAGSFYRDGEAVGFEAEITTQGAGFTGLPRLVEAQANFMKGRATFWILTSEENAELAAAIAEMLLGFIAARDILVLVDGDASAPASLMDGRPHRWSATSCAAFANGEVHNRPHWAIDLTCAGSYGAVVADYLRFRRTPILRPEPTRYSSSTIDVPALVGNIIAIVRDQRLPESMFENVPSWPELVTWLNSMRASSATGVTEKINA